MDFQKYLKYKTKYLQQKTLLQQQGGYQRFKILVQRVGLVEENLFDVVLWDKESPVYLRSDETSPRDEGYITFAMFKKDEKLAQELRYKKMWQVQKEQVPEVAKYIKDNESIHLYLMTRAYFLAIDNKNFVDKLSKVPATNQLFFYDRELATSDPSP